MSKFSISVFYGVLVTYTSEIYPTNMRSQAYGLLLTSGRIATVGLPYLLKIWDTNVGSSPLMLFSLLCVICTVIMFVLEETLDRDMDEIRTTLLKFHQESETSEKLIDKHSD